MPLAEDVSEGFGATEKVNGTHHSLPKDLRRGLGAPQAPSLFCSLVGLVERPVRRGRARIRFSVD